MTCQPVDTSEAVPPVEPVAPCTRHEFEAILAPMVKIAKRIVKANDPEYRIEDTPLEGFDTFEIRDAILAKIDAFVYWWRCQNATAVGEIICDKDDSKMAGILLSSAKHAKDRGRAEADPNEHPTVCAARSHLQASMIHDDWTAILERVPFKALVLASGKGRTNLRVDFEDQCWYADALKLRTVVRTLDSLRCRDWTVRIDWNRGWNGRAPCLTFTWHGGKGRLRVPMTYDQPWHTYPTVSFTADRTVGRAIDETPARWPVRLEPAGDVPANETARVACKKAEQPMTDKNTKATEPTNTSTPPAAAPSAAAVNALIEADLKKWSLSAFPAVGAKKQAVVVIYSNTAANKPTKIGEGRAATLPLAYAEAVKSIGTSEF